MGAACQAGYPVVKSSSSTNKTPVPGKFSADLLKELESDVNSEPITVNVRDLVTDDHTTVTVARWDNIKECVTRAMGTFYTSRVLYGGLEVTDDMRWDQLDIENDAVLYAEGSNRRMFVENVVIPDILRLNSHVCVEALTVGVEGKNRNCPDSQVSGIEWEGDDIRNWNLGKLGLKALPESFGAIDVLGDLILHENELQTLPTTFCGIYVKGTLDLRRNRLLVLPECFGQMRVGGALMLNDNQLKSLPDSIGSLTVGRFLDLSRNMLKELPDSFASLSAHGVMLHNNMLSVLPANFKDIHLEGRLFLYRNNLLPTVHPSDFVHVKGEVFTDKNPFSFKKMIRKMQSMGTSECLAYG